MDLNVAFQWELSIIFALSQASPQSCLMLKFVQVSFNLVSFAVCYGFSVSKVLPRSEAASQVGDNLLLKMDFCLLVLLLILPSFETSLFALSVLIVLPCACNLRE